MRKIPTVFRRDPENMARVLPEVHPDCAWVLAGEGIATRKYDGTCVMLDNNGEWWARREVKPGKSAPPAYVPIETDVATGKTVGWEPIEQSPFAKFHAEALRDEGWPMYVGTYELCGPKINGNPEGYPEHRLIRHVVAARINLPAPLDYRTLDRALTDLAVEGIEGIVWYHVHDGRMAKLKGRDFR